MKLIINADDFGFYKAINHGICEVFENGVVRSASIMPGMPGFDHGLSLYSAKKGAIALGVHLTLTAVTPLSPGLSTLTDNSGHRLV